MANEHVSIDDLIQDMINEEPMHKRIFLMPAKVRLKWINLITLVMALISCTITILTGCGVLVEDAFVFQLIRFLVPAALVVYVMYNTRYRLRALNIIVAFIEEANEECDKKIKEITTMIWSMDELLNTETPFLSMNDITDEDWVSLDYLLAGYDKTNMEYDLSKCQVLAFVLQQIHYDKINFYKVPLFIREGKQFKKIAIKYNPELKEELDNLL